MQRHKTSIFSEYQQNQNNSLESKQVEYWLMHLAPTSHTSPKFGQDCWNLMSTSSRYEPDVLTFAQRQNTFQSANKQNMFSNSNLLNINVLSSDQQKLNNNIKPLSHYQSLGEKSSKSKQPLQNHENVLKVNQNNNNTKSYISAMLDLQRRAKTLQEQNMMMKKSLTILNSQKRTSLQESFVSTEQIKKKSQQVNEIKLRNQKLIRENKKLKQNKDEHARRYKNMQKSVQEQKEKISKFNDQLERVLKENEQVKKQLSESTQMNKVLLKENKQLSEKNQILEKMREKSTNSILQKYSKALERIEELQIELNQMRNRQNAKTKSYGQKIEEKQTKIQIILNQNAELRRQVERLTSQINNCQKQVKDKQRIIGEKNEQLRQIKKQKVKYENLVEKYYRNSNERLGRVVTGGQKTLSQQSMRIEPSSIKSSELKSAQSPIQSRQIEQNQLFKSENNQNKQQNSQQMGDYQDQMMMTKPFCIVNNENLCQNSQGESQSQVGQTKEMMKSRLLEDNQVEISMMRRSKVREISRSKEEKNNQKEKQKSHTKSIQPLYETKRVDNKKNRSLQNHNKNSKIKQQTQQKSSKKDRSHQHKPINLNNSISNRRHSIKHQKRPKSLTKSQDKSSQIIQQSIQSRYINIISGQQNDQFTKNTMDNINMYKSAQNNNRYPKYYNNNYDDQSCYCYTNEINRMDNQNNDVQLYQQQQQSQLRHDSIVESNRMINHKQNSQCFYQNQQQITLNKALLLEFQEQALKLYEEHQKLLQKSQSQQLTNEQRAEILGRTRQIMMMIDHNTNKIFQIKEKMCD